MTVVVTLVAGAIAVVLVLYVIAIYNGLIFLKNNIDKAWSNIDVLLKQRHDELPKLVKVCEAFMKHERAVLDRLMQAREGLMAARGDMTALSKAEGVLGQALGKLLMLTENYPELKSQENFRMLQERVTSLESEIADRREYFNECVNNYNVRIESFPDMLLAVRMNLPQRPLFRVDAADREDPGIQFSAQAMGS